MLDPEGSFFTGTLLLLQREASARGVMLPQALLDSTLPEDDHSVRRGVSTS